MDLHAACVVSFAGGQPVFDGAHPGFSAVARLDGYAAGGLVLTLDKPIDATEALVMVTPRGGYAPGAAQFPSGEIAQSDAAVNVYNLTEGTAVGEIPADSAYGDTTVQVLVIRRAWAPPVNL